MMPGQNDPNKQVNNQAQPSGEKVVAQPVDKGEDNKRIPHSEAVADARKEASSAEEPNLLHLDQV
jgi:hypothetical protein